MMLLSITLAVISAIFPQLVGYAIDNFVVEQTMDGIFPFILIYALIIIVQSIVVFGFIHFAGKIDINISTDIRDTSFRKLQNLSFSYFDNTPVGWIMARLTSDTMRIGEIVAWGSVDIIHGIFMVIVILLFMFFTNWQLSLIVLAIMPIITFLSIIFQKKMLNAHRESRKMNSKITGSYNEGITGAKTTKILIRENKNFDEFEGLSIGMKKASIRAATISALYFPVLMTITGISVAILLVTGGISVLDGAISLGTLTIFIAYASQISEPISEIARVLSEMQSAQASAERTFTLLETEPDIIDKDDIIKKYGDFLNPKKENWEKITGHIIYKNIDFKYKTGETVLEDFNLEVKPGEKIALVGETGSGKSTIINLLCRFYEPTKGEILIDGINYKERPQIWLQSNLGYVLQVPHLFSGSIRDNIKYGYPEATEEEIIEAAKAVDAYDFIQKMEKGFDTDVGEGGNRLSTGEKQLISFARAIIKNPAIFVLDEATSSIDTQTENKIQAAIDKALDGRTSFIVAHRLSTIRRADRILVIEKGKITEQGSHKELISQKGHYFKLYTNQFKKEAQHTFYSQHTQ